MFTAKCFNCGRPMGFGMYCSDACDPKKSNTFAEKTSPSRRNRQAPPPQTGNFIAFMQGLVDGMDEAQKQQEQQEAEKKRVEAQKLKEFQKREQEGLYWREYFEIKAIVDKQGYDALSPENKKIFDKATKRLIQLDRYEKIENFLVKWGSIAGVSLFGIFASTLYNEHQAEIIKNTPPSISVYYTNNGKLRSIVAGTEEEKRKYCEMTSSSCKLIKSAPEGVKACIQVAPDSVESKFWSTVITPENRTNTLQELQKLCFDFYPASQCQMGPVKTYCNTTKTESLGIPLSAVDGAPGVMP